MNWRVIICLVIGAVVLSSGGVAAADDFSISTSNMVDIPDRQQSVPFSDKEDTITHVSRHETNQNLSVTTKGPEKEYRVRILAPNGGEVDTVPVNSGGEATVELETDAAPPGLYTVGILSKSANGVSTYDEIHPVVIKGYDISTTPDTTTVTQGTPVTATVTVSGGIDSDCGGDNYECQVEGALINAENGNERKSVVATKGSDEETYTASIPTTDLSQGSYELSAAVVIEGAAAEDNDNIIAFSDLSTITLNEDTDESESNDSDDSQNNNNNDDSSNSGSDGDGDGSESSDGAGGGGGGGSGGPNILNAPGARSVDEVREIASLFAADSETEVETTDGTATVSEATTVDTVEFNSVESTSVSVAEYNSPSEEFEENIIDSAKADGVDVSQEDTVVSFSEIKADIPVTEDASATVTFTVNKDNGVNADSISIVKEVTTENGNNIWEEKSTTVVNAGSDTVTVETEVDSFSMFAIVEQSGTSDDPQSSANRTGNETGSGSSSDNASESEAPLPLTIPVVALLLVAVYFRRQV